MSKKIDKCSKCGYERNPVRPSDMLCSVCEGRMVETEKDDDKSSKKK